MINKFFKALLAILAIIVAVIIAYNLFVFLSINSEEAGRLQDPDTLSALLETSNLDSENGIPVLIMHGFGGSPHDFRYLIEELNKREIAFLAPCIAGHCTDSVRKFALSTHEQWRLSAQQALAELKEQGYEKINVVGFSMGGLLALDLADDPVIQKIVVVSPYTEVPFEPYHILPVSTWQNMIHNVLPYVKKFAPGQITNRELQNIYVPSYLHLPLDAVRELNEFSRLFWGEFESPQQPVFIVISENDAVSSPEKLDEYAQKFFTRETDKILTVQHSNHIVLYDNDKEKTIDEILEFWGY